MIEILCVRDPDGDTDLTVWVDGRLVEYPELVVHDVDAGRGYTYEDWEESKKWSLECASPAARDAVEAAYGDPPGRKYIDGWEE